MPTRPPLPVTRAILLADTILTEAGTLKKSLIGMYSRIMAPRLPVMRPLNVYAQLADAAGEYQFEIFLVRLETNQVISRGEIGPIHARDRLQPLEIIMHLPGRFEAHGEYEIRIAFEGNIFASRIFSVLDPSAAKPPEGDAPPGGQVETDR